MKCGSWGPYLSQMTELCSFPINNTPLPHKHTHTHTLCKHSTQQTTHTPAAPAPWDLLVWNIEVVWDWEPEAERADWIRNPRTHPLSFFFLFALPCTVLATHPPSLMMSVLGLTVNRTGDHYCVQLHTHTQTRTHIYIYIYINTLSEHFTQLNEKMGMISLQLRNQPLVKIE